MDIYSLTPSMAESLLSGYGASRAAVNNIFKDIYRYHARSFDDMSNTGGRIKRALSERYEFVFPHEVKRIETDDCVKFLLRLSDGEYIESVLMRQNYGSSVCVSSQVGCAMGCVFCQSGKNGRTRSLTAGEMVSQLLYIERALNIKITNVSVMGIGEPFDNYDAVSDFCDIITDDNALAVPPKRVTVSTCGIVGGIDRFAKRQRPCSLALSLHAAFDDKRTRLMPINKKYPLAECMRAAARYAKLTNRRVLLEYTLLSGINDGDDDAYALSTLALSGDFTVNLIEYNTTDGGEYNKSDRLMQFYRMLKGRGVRVTLRRKFGGEINAGCGQLRSSVIGKAPSDEIQLRT